MADERLADGNRAAFMERDGIKREKERRVLPCQKKTE